MRFLAIALLLLVHRRIDSFVPLSTRSVYYHRSCPLGCIVSEFDEASTTPAEQLASVLREAVESRSLIKLSLLDNRHILDKNIPSDSDPTLPSKISLRDLKSISGRLVEIKDGVKLQLQLRYLTNDKTFNFSPEETASVIQALCGSFKKVSVVTATGLVTLKNGKQLKTVAQKAKATASPLSLQHDRRKNVPVETTAPFLHALMITTAEGRPRAGMADKLRQIQRFVEILAGLVDKSNPRDGGIDVEFSDVEDNSAGARIGGVSNSGNMGQSEPLRIVDMGSGMAYLTFAIHDHLSSRTPRGLLTTGIEARQALVAQTQKIADDLGYEGLNFVHSTIEEYISSTVLKEGGGPGGKVDVLVALHACDTATDDAIFCGIRGEASVIVVSPCCHKEARGQMDAHFSSLPSNQESGALGDLLRHSLFRERESEMVTDAVRALLLDMSGYDVSVLDFVAGEHTAKNVMLAAVKRKAQTGTTVQQVQDSQGREAMAERVRALMGAFGIKRLKLASLLDVLPTVPNTLPLRRKARTAKKD